MKKHLFLLFAALGMLSASYASCLPANRVVENPLIGYANTSTVDITKIEMSDTATVLHIEAYFRPKAWIKMASDTYLRAEGHKYVVQGAEGIQLDSLFWMPDSGRASFTLKFGALPRGLKSFDFIESDCADCFKLYDVDLTGRTEYPTYPDGFPKALRKSPKDGPVPDPTFKSGKTTVELHLLGFRDGMIEEVDMYVNSLIGRQNKYSATVDADGTATFTFKQYGPGNAHVVNPKNNSVFGGFWIAPGETMDVYVDLAESGKQLVARRDATKYEEMKRSYRPFLYSTGSYGDLSTLFTQAGARNISLNLYTGNFADYRMSADEYTQMVESKYKALADSIARSDADAMVKEIRLLSVQQEVVAAISNASYLLEHNYRSTNKLWDRRAKIDYEFAKLEQKHFEQIAKLFDVNNPKLALGIAGLEYSAIAKISNWQDIVAPDGLPSEMSKAMPMFAKAENNKLTEEDIAMLRALKNPLFAEACSDIQNEVRKVLAQMQDVSMEQTPEVANEQLFDAIIAPYKGKVIFVDFWNTWCSPCQYSIKETEPLKSAELKSDDLVWIYIANETSPLGTYKTNIAKIQGKHYRLNPEQWSYLCEKFQIDGIPSYVLVEKDGTYKLREDFRDHNLMKRTLQEMIK